MAPPTGTANGTPSIEAMLRVVPGFEELASPVLAQIASVGNIAEVPQGEVLFRQGAVPESLYVLLDGRVSLTGTAADASSAVIDILGPNSSFVLANALTGEPYEVGAEAVAHSTVIRIPVTSIRAVVTAQPTAAMAMMRAMSAELGAMTRQVVDLKVRIAAQRLGAYLLTLIEDPTARRVQFRLPVNKGLLASWLGCRAENLSRAFVALRAYGVETHGSRVLLHDVARLRAYAGAAVPDADTVSHGLAAGRAPVETILGDAFRLRPGRPRKDRGSP
jgi:CRP/FNR family transcriptional regulator, transcriptional activator FtrB